MGVSLKKDNLVYPYFVIAGKDKKQAIKNFPGVFRFSVDRLLKDVGQAAGFGLSKVLLFGVSEDKDSIGSAAYGGNNIIAGAIRRIKEEFPDIVVMTDVCLCAYTAHGHCGIIKPQAPRHKPEAKIDNKETLKALVKTALSHAYAGADWVAPSAMARGQVLAVRTALDKSGFKKTRILGYSAKFASNFYGPFRSAARSAPSFGDRSGYQLAYSGTAPALKEIADDIRQGADMVMVKPALSYLDVIREAGAKFDFPLAAYNVSGEYAFVKHGAKTGLWQEKDMALEVLTSIKRAGADLIITYHAKDAARLKWFG